MSYIRDLTVYVPCYGYGPCHVMIPYHHKVHTIQWNGDVTILKKLSSLASLEFVNFQCGTIDRNCIKIAWYMIVSYAKCICVDIDFWATAQFYYRCDKLISANAFGIGRPSPRTGLFSIWTGCLFTNPELFSVNSTSDKLVITIMRQEPVGCHGDKPRKYSPRNSIWTRFAFYSVVVVAVNSFWFSTGL